MISVLRYKKFSETRRALRDRIFSLFLCFLTDENTMNYFFVRIYFKIKRLECRNLLSYQSWHQNSYSSF